MSSSLWIRMSKEGQIATHINSGCPGNRGVLEVEDVQKGLPTPATALA
jgi:hypothetical protein